MPLVEQGFFQADDMAEHMNAAWRLADSRFGESRNDAHRYTN